MLAATANGCTDCGAVDVIPTSTTFVVTGASGSGKTAVAAQLHALLPSAVVVDTDNFLSAPQFGHEAYVTALLQVAYTVIQGGRTPVLCGTLMPEALDAATGRDLLGDIVFINLDCSDAERGARLRSRPPWRKSSSESVIADHISFAAQLRCRPDMTSVDTTGSTDAESAQRVAQMVAAEAGRRSST
jgi:hypothetical protein